MTATTLLKNCINRCLEKVNLRLETLTIEKLERQRLKSLADSGYFARPVFPLSPCFSSINVEPVLRELSYYAHRFQDFVHPSRNDVGYSFNNPWFSSPDAEVLYTLLLKFQPGKVIEIGSGYSTRIMRQAILDGSLQTRLISIDPSPRTDITTITDEFYCERVELSNTERLFSSLTDQDIVFIDSSHEIKTGNDVVFLYTNVIPNLPKGVLIHLHDVFLPYEYPSEWILKNGWAWNEQNLVQSLLMFSRNFDVIWAGHFLQRTLENFEKYFPHMNERYATSLWLQKVV